MKSIQTELKRMNTQEKIDKLAKAKGIVNSTEKKQQAEEEMLVDEVVMTI